MGLTMSAATYARDNAGRSRLKNDFNSDIEAFVNVINGSRYTDLVKYVKANWVGADADDFLRDIDKTRADLIRDLRSLKTRFNEALEADAREFASFQSKNIK